MSGDTFATLFLFAFVIIGGAFVVGVICVLWWFQVGRHQYTPRQLFDKLYNQYLGQSPSDAPKEYDTTNMTPQQLQAYANYKSAQANVKVIEALRLRNQANIINSAMGFVFMLICVAPIAIFILYLALFSK